MTDRRRGSPALLLALLAMLTALGACARTTAPPGFLDAIARQDPKTFTCCADPERLFPADIANAAVAILTQAGPPIAERVYASGEDTVYPGQLTEKPAAQAELMARLRPLDLVLVAHKSVVLGRVFPGWFTHVYIYTGNEAELRAAGLWTRPEIAPHHDEIRAGKMFVSGVAPVARLDTVATVLQVDAAAILRPALGTSARRTATLAAFQRLGTPYDFSFAADTPGKLVCTSLVDQTMPSLALTRREAYGRAVILPDDLGAQAIRGERLHVVGYLAGTDDGYEWRGIRSMMADIALRWGKTPS